MDRTGSLQSAGGSGHHHELSDSSGAANRRALTLVFALTSAYVVAEVAGGLLTGSLALLADAGHTLTDAFALGMALAAIWFARRPATPSRTYGFYRAEILAALVNSIIPFAIAGVVLYEAWRRFQQPPEVHGLPMLVVAGAGAGINLLALRLLHGSGENLNVRAALLEVLADLVGAIGVIVAGATILLTGWRPIDPLISAAIGLFILPRAWRLLRSVLDVLLEATPKNIDLGELERQMKTVPGVAAIHELHAWTITSGYVALSAHVEAETRPSAEILHDLQVLLRTRFSIQHATLQIEGPEHAEDGVCCVLDPRCLVISQSRRTPEAAHRPH